MSTCFHIQEDICRSHGSNDSFEDFLPAIEVMSICTQLSKQKSALGTEKRRLQFSLMPAVFGVHGSSPPHVTSWGYKPFPFPKIKENTSKRRRVGMAKMNRRDECRFEEHSQRWGYSSPAFLFRSLGYKKECCSKNIYYLCLEKISLGRSPWAPALGLYGTIQ